MTIRDGIIEIAPNLIVKPDLTETEFLSSPAGAAAKAVIKNGSHHSYKHQNTEVEGRSFIPVLYFSSGKLTEIQLHPVTADKGGWDAYSDSSKTVKKLANDNWLKKNLGTSPPYLFHWGVIESVSDQKGGMTFVLLRYSKI